MEHAYKPEHWHDFYVMLGTASASLVGLFFIATSLHLEDIMKNMILRMRARNVTMAMLMLMVQSAVVLIPQAPALLGAEVIIIDLMIIQFPILAGIRMRRSHLPIPLARIGIGILAVLLSMAGGAGLILQIPSSFYLIAVGNLILLIVLVANAWSLMLGVFQSDNPS